MTVQSQPKSARRLALAACAVGAILFSPAAIAQGDGRYDETAAPNGAREPEQVYVYGPRLHVERSAYGGIEKVSLSRAVRYDDLDLRTSPGAHELRLRIRNAAQDICEQLEAAYPFPQELGTSCYRTAVQNALWHADNAIREARSYSD